VSALLAPPSRRGPNTTARRLTPHLVNLEERNPPGSILAWVDGLDGGDPLPAVVDQPAPAVYSQRDLAWSSAVEPAFDVAPRASDSGSEVPADSQPAADSATTIDYLFTSLTLGAPDTQGDLTQSTRRPGSPAPLPPPAAPLSGGGGGGSIAPALTSQSAAAPSAPAASPVPGVNNAQMLSLLGTNASAGAPTGAPLTSAPAVAATPATPAPAPAPAAAPAAVATPPAATPTTAVGPTRPAGHPTASPQGPSASDPLYVLDLNDGLTLPSNVTLNSFSGWQEDLLAQVSGTAVASYQWNVSQAPDLTNVSGTTTANLQGTWQRFTGSASFDTISVTETPKVGQALTLSYTFEIASLSSPANGSRPTTSGTWASVITPDLLVADEATAAAGPDASLGLADGSAQTSFRMPSYNPNTDPLQLDYSSTAASSQPIFLVHYQLPTTLPSNVTAQLTLNGNVAATVTYNPSNLNPGDFMQLALQANALGLSTGRYPYQISVNNGSATATFTGSVDIVNQAASPEGAGWSFDNVEQLVPVSGGVILVEPGGTSLWFANATQAGSFVTPTGDFSNLTQNTQNNTYTRTLPDGTKINFNSTGRQTAIVDTDGNSTNFGYNLSNLLTSVTDFNGQATTLAYSASNQLTKITDPAGRSATLAYDTAHLTSITDPLGEQWKYGYDASHNLTTLTDPRGNATSFGYDFAHRVTGVTQADNTTLKLDFQQLNGLAASGSSNVTGVLLATGAQAQLTDPRNNVWTTEMDWLGFGLDTENIDPLANPALTYRDTNGMPWMSADALGRRTREAFDNLGNATVVVAPDDTTQSYQYNGFSELTQYTDQEGNLTSYAYNTNGDLTKTTDALSEVATAAYNTHGPVTSTTDARGAVTSYNYDSLNRVTKIVDALNDVTTLAYDNASNVTQTTDARGFVNTYAYDLMGDVTSETLAVGTNTSATYTFGYDKVGNLTSATDPLNHSTTYGFDKLDRQTSLTDALGHQTTFGLDAAGNVTSMTDPLGRQSTYAFDAADRITSATDAAGDQTTASYDAASEITSLTDPLGHVYQFTYTLRGQLLQIVFPPPGNNSPASIITGPHLVCSFSYCPCGCVKSETFFQQSTGAVTPNVTGPLTYTFADDALLRITSVTDPLGYTTSWSYDANSNKTLFTDPLGNPTTYSFDKLNRLTSQTDALGDQTTAAYDAVGNLTSVTDPLGRVTTAAYDALGEMLSVTDPRNAQTTFGYDLAGNLTALTDSAGNLTSYQYNAVNLATKMTDPLGNSATSAFDAANQLTSTTDRNGRTTNYAYDQAGRLTQETWVNGSYTATYGYDRDSRLTQAQDPFSSYTFGYDAVGDLTSASNAGTPGMPAVNLSYGYDIFMDRTAMTDNLGGSITYGYDSDQRLTSMGMALTNTLDAQVTLSYNQDSLLTQTVDTVPGSTTTITQSLSYDKVNRLTNQTWLNGSTTAANYTYGYDKASQLTSYQDANSGQTYGYDKSGQLTNATGTLNGQTFGATYVYDPNGNRTTSTVDLNGSLSSSTYTTAKANELTSDSNYTYAYDKEGNLTSQTQKSNGQTTSYTYDFRNRLVEAKLSTSTGLVLQDEKFTYDVNGNRIGLSLNGTQQLWTAYDGSNPYIDFNGSTQVTERYFTNPTGGTGQYARVSATGTVNWYVTDNLGSVRQIIGSNGTVLDTLTYDPFGNRISETSFGNGDRFKFADGSYDSTFANYQFGARYYTPADGRFESQDPLQFGGNDTNLYRYVTNDPTYLTDQLGLADKFYGDILPNGTVALYDRYGQWIGTLDVKTKLVNRHGYTATLANLRAHANSWSVWWSQPAWSKWFENNGLSPEQEKERQSSIGAEINRNDFSEGCQHAADLVRIARDFYATAPTLAKAASLPIIGGRRPTQLAPAGRYVPPPNQVENGHLQQIVSHLYQGAARSPGERMLGARNLADLVRAERAIGRATHTQEALNRINQLSNLENLSAADQAAADIIIADLLHAVNTPLR
jgi:RHS repeat-associated protein